MQKPVVAIVGRPNVGKSTLFNRLAERRMAIVDDIPGTTRDRLITEVEWTGVIFDIIDTGGLDPTQVGPGKGQEPLSIGSHQFIEEIRSQAEIAIQESDAILFVVDGQAGVTPADREINESLRKISDQNSFFVNRREYRLIQTPQCFHAELIKKGEEIELNDCLIAATSLSLGIQEIATRDIDHFNRIEGIRAIMPEELGI